MHILKNNSTLSNILRRFSVGFIAAYSFGACTDVGIIPCLIASSLYTLFFNSKKSKLDIWSFAIILIALFVYNDSGILGLFLTGIISGVVYMFSGLIPVSMNKTKYLGGFELATALTCTALFTTLYFGIGAKGNTFIEIMKDYISLGFHPNWRGILYGTIVMVVMITFPRKFKNVGKIISPAFVAVFLTILLNIFLIPKNSVYPIEFVKLIDYFAPITLLNAFKPANTDFVIVLLSSISIALVNRLRTDDAEVTETIMSGCANTFSNFICPSFLVSNINRTKNDFIEGIVSSILIILFAYPMVLYTRTPLASVAVVLIVGAWQSVNWNDISSSLKSVKTTFVLIITFVFTLVVGINVSSLTIFIIYYLFSRQKRKIN